MQKRSHKLLAATLLENTQGFQARRFELAFLFGSFQPDCNPLTYLKGSLRAYKFRGHNYSNSQHYIYSRISRLQRRQRWTIWQYYTLGKLTHYLADAFTYPHNENYPDSMLCHHQYETDLRAYLEEYLATRALRREKFRQDVADALQELHRQYMAGVADMRKDVQFILKATSLLMAGCLPASAAAAVWTLFWEKRTAAVSLSAHSLESLSISICFFWCYPETIKGLGKEPSHDQHHPFCRIPLL